MALKQSYNPEKDIPDLTGKVYFITGGTAGLGEQTILGLAKHNPAHIFFTGRNTKKVEAIIQAAKKIAPTLSVTFCECDQASLTSVNAAASKFLSIAPNRLDVLIANAGIMGGPPGLTKDGFEVQFGINFLSHALFTKRLLPVLERTSLNHGEARIINLTSVAYTMYSGGLPLDDLKTAQLNIGMGGKWARYGQSKFATVIYTAEMAKRYPKVTTVALHPGVVHTGLIEDLPFFDRIFIKLNTIGQSIPIHEGAYNTLWAATTPNKDNLKSGAIYYPVGAEQKPTKAATDEILWEKLWTWTEEQLNSSCGGVQ